MSELVVLVTDYTWPSTEVEAAALRSVPARLLIAQSGDEDELLRLVQQADAILTCFRKVSAAVVRAGEKLKVIGRYGTGVDSIAVDEATRLGISVTNVPAYCLNEVAEDTLALLLACACNIPHYDRSIRSADWRLNPQCWLFRVSGKVLGIVGLGQIGRALAVRAHGHRPGITRCRPYSGIHGATVHSCACLRQLPYCLRPMICRASSGVATSRPISRAIRTAFSTSSAFVLA